MANEQNLVKGGEAHRLTAEEASKGGIASGEARRKKKAFRELMEHYLSQPATVNGEQVTRKDVATVRAVQMLTENELSAAEFVRLFELVRDTIGEKPTEHVEVATADQAKFNELLDQLKDG